MQSLHIAYGSRVLRGYSGLKKGDMNNKRLEKARKLLKLAYRSGHLKDRDDLIFPDINADALIYSAIKLIDHALIIQYKK